MRRLLLGTALGIGLGAMADAGPTAAQGLFGLFFSGFVFDPAAYAQGEAIREQQDGDLAVQADRQEAETAAREIERQQIAALNELIAVLSVTPGSSGGTAAMLEGLEGEAGDPTSASAVFGPVQGEESGEDRLQPPNGDPNPAAPRLFGDASGTVEELIVQVAIETSNYPGVIAAGLSPVQWRCLLQAMIWQESRFQVGARSPAAAFGLTQIIPGTAQQLGIYPAYYEDPYLQVEGGARYLSEQLQTFDGNIVFALAAYNAGPGRVQQYGGVPPFAETQHYVQVIPAKYNEYLAMVGGVDALGTIDPVLLAGSTLSMTSDAAMVYAGHTNAMLANAARRLRSIVERISETADPVEAVALNTYARAEIGRLTVMMVRLQAASTRPLSAEQVAMAATQAAERDFLDFTPEPLE